MEKELEFDARKLLPAEQENLRKKIVRKCKKHENEHKTLTSLYAFVADDCECSVSHVRHTWDKYRKKGVSGIKQAQMGRPKGNTKLTSEQIKEIKKTITEKDPNQLKMAGFLWDRASVKEYIKRVFKVDVPISTMGRYLREWGFTAQRPNLHNYKQNPEQIKKWLEEDYPAIKARAKAENAEINWFDETRVQNESNYVKGYAPRGKTPSMPTGNSKIHLNMMSSVTNQGKLRFMLYEENCTAKTVRTFLKRLIKTSERKVFAIMDNLKVHHAKLVSEFVAKNPDKIAIFYLPPYSPEHNPDEYVNGCLKREMAKKGYSKTVSEIERKARGSMKKLQRDSEKVKRLFDADKVSYAA